MVVRGNSSMLPRPVSHLRGGSWSVAGAKYLPTHVPLHRAASRLIRRSSGGASRPP
jgi:hypothetical protein